MVDVKVGRFMVALAIAALAAKPSIVRGDEPASESAFSVGAQVVLKSRDVTMQVGPHTVSRPDVFRVYRVEQVEGARVWLASDRVHGWAQAGDVVPLDRATGYFTAAVERDSTAAWAYKMRALVHYEQGKLDRALADDNEALRLEPRDATTWANRALVWIAKREYNRAVADAREAIRLDPRDAAAYQNRATAWFYKKDYELAIADYNEAVRLDPTDPEKLTSRALVWTKLGEYDLALADYGAALRLDPDAPAAYQGRAWIRATAPDASRRDGRAAVGAATRACELTGWKDPYCLGTLAAAHAERGEFSEAAKWQSKALTLLAKDDPDRVGHRRRLELYRAGKPYRDEPRAR